MNKINKINIAILELIKRFLLGFERILPE